VTSPCDMTNLVLRGSAGRQAEADARVADRPPHSPNNRGSLTEAIAHTTWSGPHCRRPGPHCVACRAASRPLQALSVRHPCHDRERPIRLAVYAVRAPACPRPEQEVSDSRGRFTVCSPSATQRSSTSFEQAARDTQMNIVSLASRSAGVSRESRWSTSPFNTGVSHVPQVPS